MARFCTLSSSSKGNCTYLSGGGTNILVDAGISCRAITRSLADLSVELGELAAIFITHEHTDHIRGLQTLLKRVHIPIYGTLPTLNWLVNQGHIPPGADLRECTGTMCVGALQLTPFATPHDATCSVGYRVDLPDERVVGIATDLGHITDEVREALHGCDLVLLESNYDRAMLQAGPYPYFLKRRVGGTHGHLSNDECAEQVLELVRGGTTRIVLGHLSENNNLPAIARETVFERLAREGVREQLDYTLQVAPARQAMNLMAF